MLMVDEEDGDTSRQALRTRAMARKEKIKNMRIKWCLMLYPQTEDEECLIVASARHFFS